MLYFYFIRSYETCFAVAYYTVHESDNYLFLIKLAEKKDLYFRGFWKYCEYVNESFKKTYRKIERYRIKMIIPIRCLSCGKPIGHLWEEFKERVEKGENAKDVLDSLGVERYCCRGVFVGHVELIDTVAQFKKN